MVKYASILLSPFLLTACLGAAESPVAEDVGVSESPALNLNGLSANALNLNGLNLHALDLDELHLHELDVNRLSAHELAAIRDPGPSGDLSREVLSYTVNCALTSTQSLRFAWTDSAGLVHDEAYVGHLGLASDWAERPLDTVGQEWVSACLASRVNWYGVSVLISMRGQIEPLERPASPEAPFYTAIEGAFWGNLFDRSQSVYTCDDTPDDAHSRALMRDCAAGHVEPDGTLASCGIIQRVGPCSEACKMDRTGYMYTTCRSARRAAPTKRAITIGLPPAQ